MARSWFRSSSRSCVCSARADSRLYFLLSGCFVWEADKAFWTKRSMYSRIRATALRSSSPSLSQYLLSHQHRPKQPLKLTYIVCNLMRVSNHMLAFSKSVMNCFCLAWSCDTPESVADAACIMRDCELMDSPNRKDVAVSRVKLYSSGCSWRT